MALAKCRNCNYKFELREGKDKPKSCPYCNTKDSLAISLAGKGMVRDVDDYTKDW